ncbi:hypothetical protein [Myceligenerans salitolerans]|uniref:MftR C-terminal domain-containing protein n=1 Tax=Myceligenerans salitolerans TaxID=1230528 RepID=A0ABS3IA48_9MICO|nr:hypothetical protein [Myceligenerans salitolerans]MBO0609815.1 hypothetical protein [Myceligenerans salitolerans]
MDTVSWAAHRRAVVHTVRRRVPLVDPEVATSRGLAILCARIVADGAVDRPADIWCEAAVDAALAMLRETILAASRRPDPATADDMPGADA